MKLELLEASVVSLFPISQCRHWETVSDWSEHPVWLCLDVLVRTPKPGVYPLPQQEQQLLVGEF